MSLSDILGHDRCRNDVVLEARMGVRFRNASENPEKVLAKISLSFPADAARTIARHECFNLDMDEPRSGEVAAQNVGVRRVSQCDHSRISSPTELTSDKELACVSPCTFFFLRHDGDESLPFDIRRSQRQSTACHC